MATRRMMFAGCLHKRPTDISTIHGYVKCNVAVQESLMQEITNRNVDTFFSMGDWFDKGYGTDVPSALIDTEIDRDMAKLLNGNFYGVIGNHIRLHLDSNPELFLIQPHDTLKMRRKIKRKEQIIRTPRMLMINGVQISLCHYKQDATSASDYQVLRHPDAKYHIALYHTPLVIPSVELYKLNMQYEASSNSRISEALHNVDLAIVGDIHKPLGQFSINHKDGKITTMIVPGSLTNTNTNMDVRHESINIPLIEINDAGEVKLEYVYFDLHTNLLTFESKMTETETSKLKSTRGNTVKNLYGDENEDVATKLTDEKVAVSMNLFMRQQGYTDSDINMVQGVIHDPSNTEGILKTYIGGVLNVE